MSITTLVPVFSGELDGQPVQLVNARDLHFFLESEQRFIDWIKGRIEQYGFEAGKDFFIILRKSRGRPRIDYHVTLDTAKELAMVERTARGRQARRYFIECERKAHQIAAPDALAPELRQAIQNKALALALAGYEEIRARLEQRIREQRHLDHEELLRWLDRMGGPDAELVVLSAHDLWALTTSVAVAFTGVEGAISQVDVLEKKLKRPWRGRANQGAFVDKPVFI